MAFIISGPEVKNLFSYRDFVPRLFVIDPTWNAVCGEARSDRICQGKMTKYAKEWACWPTKASKTFPKLLKIKGNLFKRRHFGNYREWPTNCDDRDTGSLRPRF